MEVAILVENRLLFAKRQCCDVFRSRIPVLDKASLDIGK